MTCCCIHEQLCCTHYSVRAVFPLCWAGLGRSARSDWPWGLTPGGLMGPAYNGHVFWCAVTKSGGAQMW